MRWAIRAVTALALLAALAAVKQGDPQKYQLTRDIAAVGSIGQRVQTADFVAKVVRVAAAHEVAGQGSKPEPTGGIWLIVSVIAQAARDPVALNSTQLLTPNGDQFNVGDVPGAGDTIDRTQLQPDVPSEGVMVFQLPPDQLAGAQLLLRPLQPVITTGLGPEAKIDLKISAAQARQLVATASARSTLPAVVGGGAS